MTIDIRWVLFGGFVLIAYVLGMIATELSQMRELLREMLGSTANASWRTKDVLENIYVEVRKDVSR